MSDERDEQERPCLHCMIVELIDEFFDEYPAATGGSDTALEQRQVIPTQVVLPGAKEFSYGRLLR